MRDKLFRKALVVGIIILFIGMSVFPSTAINKVKKTIIPSSSGNTFYVGGDGPGNYSSIQEAIENASDGNYYVRDTVFVFNDSSPYHENVVIDKTIKLYGEDKGSTVIDGSGSDDVIVRINSFYCAIMGFKIKGGNFKYDTIGIKIGSSESFVGNNIIMDVDQGIYMCSGSNDNYFSGNIISNVTKGITAYYSDDNGIISNNISSCGLYGIHIFGSKGNYYFDNNHIGYNEILNNNIGIRIEGSNENKVWANLIFDNSGGLEFCCESDNNIIFCNNFWKNQNWNARDEGISQWDTGKKGNYWDDYDGTDADGDGIGDTPYSIPGGDNVDRYPLMEPWENHPPSKPIITGPTNGRIRVKYEYTFKSTDPDGDYLRYIINWGDGDLKVTPLVPSGVEVTVNHTYYSEGTKTISAFATDEFHWSGSLAEFEVTMPRNRATTNNLFLRFLEQFPLLERLLSLIRM